MKLSKKTILVGAVLAILAIIPAINASSKNKDAVVFTADNTVNANGEVSSESVAQWANDAKKLDQKGSGPIYLVLNTPGGSIVDGINFIEAMKGMRRPVVTVTVFAASMGFQIAQNLGERLILKNGILMSHHARGQIAGEFGGSPHSQMDSRYEFWLEIVRNMDQQTVDRTNGKQTLKSYTDSYENELWLTGPKAIAGGYADRIVTASCDASLSGTTKNSTNFLGLEISFDQSKCPMITGPLNVMTSIVTTKGLMNEKVFQTNGGEFGASCLRSADVNKLCALDTTLNPEKLMELKQRFRTNFLAKQHEVVYMTVGK